MQSDHGVPPAVLIRDFIIFQVKTIIDGIKDAIVIPLSAIAFLLDLLWSRRKGRIFYALMGACETFDRWLNLHGATKAMRNRDGLFGESRPGDGTMVGDLEGLVRGRDHDRRPAMAGTGSSPRYP
ncbi:MAG TPA: hypothetical protein VFQ45_15655 [Longimicrobium sp.]|nr:hypothetical protein [Longimicrobium sp.]